MNPPPEISIIVSNYNNSDLLNGALESVVTTAGDIALDITVIDDASTDGGFAHVSDRFKNDPRFFFVRNEKNVGISALNIVYGRAGRYIMTLDADARLHEGALKNMIAFMDGHPEAGIATANLRNQDGSPQLYYRKIFTPKLFFFTTLPGRFIDKYFFNLRTFNYYRYIGMSVEGNPEVEQPPVACLILRREAIDPNIMDPTMYLLSIDVDLCKRAYDKGFKIYLVSDALVTHLKSVSFAKRESAWRRHEYYDGLRLYFRKHNPVLFPFLWGMMWVDRGLRAVVTLLLKREILR